MSGFRSVALLGALLAGAGIAALSGAAQPALAPDRGRFAILQRGSAMGVEDFTIVRLPEGWSARGQIVLNLPGRNPECDSADLALAPDGSPLRYHWEELSGSGARSIDVEFHGNVAGLTLHGPWAAPAVASFAFSEGRIVLLDRNVYEDYVIVARLYDWKARGPQKFSYLIPQDQTSGTITVQELGPHPIDGAVLELLRVRNAEVEADLYVDDSHRLVRLRIPGSGIEAVRE
jgi:hypothetical protein